ncbi:MAG: hypothetical protein GTN78_13470, partial [Gemmatimonadales bacterium]|nr:hypothetical protein [Gemmatimonadales bacterium]
MLVIHMAEADVERLGEAALEVLESVGGLFQNAEMLDALEAAGAAVDRAAQTVRFPKKMTRDFLATLRQESASTSSSYGSNETLSAGWRTPAISSPGSAGPSDGPRIYTGAKLPTLEVQVAQFLYDLEQGEARPGRRDDLIELVKLGDVLHQEDGVGHALLMRDVPPLAEPIEAALVLAEYAHVPGQVFAWDVRQIPYLEEMARILGSAEFFTLGSICIAHPLRFDRAVAERTVEMAKRSQSIGLTAMPVVGMSTPVTMEGFIAMASAEMLACWIAGRAINPSVPLGGDMWAGVPDMRTGTV